MDMSSRRGNLAAVVLVLVVATVVVALAWHLYVAVSVGEALGHSTPAEIAVERSAHVHFRLERLANEGDLDREALDKLLPKGWSGRIEEDGFELSTSISGTQGYSSCFVFEGSRESDSFVVRSKQTSESCD
jgi:hypothetical protein